MCILPCYALLVHDGERNMEPTRFDDLTKALATATTRRQSLKIFAAAVAGGALWLSDIGRGLAFESHCHWCPTAERPVCCIIGIVSFTSQHRNRWCCPPDHICGNPGKCCPPGYVYVGHASCCPDYTPFLCIVRVHGRPIEVECAVNVVHCNAVRRRREKEASGLEQ